MEVIPPIFGSGWIRHKWWLIMGSCLLIPIAIYFLDSNLASLPVPSFIEVQGIYRSSDIRFLDRGGSFLQRVRIDSTRRNLDWFSLNQISPSLVTTVLEAEDRNFYRHSGVEWGAVLKGLSGWMIGRGERGASTISMQLSSLLAPALRPAKNQRRSPWQKWQQIQTARQLERSWTKPQILEAYFNLVSFRGELQGVAAASAVFFGKLPHGLNDEESALLAVLLRDPNASLELATRRANRLLQTLNRGADISQMPRLAKAALGQAKPASLEPGWAPHAARRILKEYSSLQPKGKEILTTIDGPLQRYALEVLQRQLLSLSSQNVKDGAVLIIENSSGKVLAYLGNSGPLSSAPLVDGIQARRQAGSTLKPFLYSLAFEKRLITAASMLEDAPLEIPVSTGIYRPENYNRRFLGLVTARTALASSLNIPAVRLILLTGIEPFTALLGKLGFRDLEDSSFYGPSLALGSADVTLWDLTNAYRCLASGGVWSNLKLSSALSQGFLSHRVFSPPVAYLVSDILSDRESRATTFNLENPLSTRFWSAVKTGTSKDMRDNWCIGYSRHYTTGVWVGNFYGESMWNVSGIMGAAPVWIEIMSYLHQAEFSTPPRPPASLTKHYIQIEAPPRTHAEWFLTGTEPADNQKAAPIIPAKITSPVAGSVIALDPDIPPDRQRVMFEAQPATASFTWFLNGQEITAELGRVLWSPEPGRFNLELRDAKNRILDNVKFEVRGNVNKLDKIPSEANEKVR
jgi:penicillin-binding protein 1C